MAGTNHSTNLHVGKFEPSSRLKTLAMAFTAIGIILFFVGMLKHQEKMWPAYLTAFFFVSCLGLGGLFWVSINNISKAGWSVSIRRITEGTTAFIPVIILGSMVLVLFGGLKQLYPWANPEVIASEPMIAAKTAYLNKGFLIARLLVFGIGMWLFAKTIIGHSIQQDHDGKEEHTHKNVAVSIGFILFFALSFSLFSVDLLMSLLPTWYSTIFGIYCFAGLFQSSLAFFVLLLIYFKHKGFVTGYYTAEHIHDVAKFMKGFTVFWAYIAFSQFMLIWYANIPEETEFFILRSMDGGWMAISFGLLIFKFIVPFIALLPRGAKRNENHLILVSLLILFMQYVDIYWLVYPNFNENHVVVDFYTVGMLLGFLGILGLTMIKFYQKYGLVALKDPRMEEALHHHVTY